MNVALHARWEPQEIIAIWLQLFEFCFLATSALRLVLAAMKELKERIAENSMDFANPR